MISFFFLLVSLISINVWNLYLMRGIIVWFIIVFKLSQIIFDARCDPANLIKSRTWRPLYWWTLFTINALIVTKVYCQRLYPSKYLSWVLLWRRENIAFSDKLVVQFKLAFKFSRYIVYSQIVTDLHLGNLNINQIIVKLLS